MEGREVLVSYSCGKDSMILMDIAHRVARKVDAFIMELVPRLPSLDERIRWAEEKWGTPIRRYPHWARAFYKREGVYCFPSEVDYRLDLNDIYALARADSGIDFLVMGAKKGDSLWRRRTAAMKFAKDNIAAPIWDWSTRDVFAYLKARNLPVPATGRAVKSGVDLTTEDILELHDRHRSSFHALEKDFPFVGAIVKRREWFGVGDYYGDKPKAEGG